jgi:raffinose/stachyose/melibiose transport system substrate-binding protein
MTGSDFPDVFHSWGGGWLKDFVDAGLVADITSYTRDLVSVVGQNNVNFAKYDNKAYGIPYMGGLAGRIFSSRQWTKKFSLPIPFLSGPVKFYQRHL